MRPITSAIRHLHVAPATEVIKWALAGPAYSVARDGKAGHDDGLGAVVNHGALALGACASVCLQRDE